MFGEMANVFVGLALTFAVMGLVVSALTEALAKILKWRANSLVQGLGTLLNDRNLSGLAKDLLNHGAIVPHGTADNVTVSSTGPVAKPDWIAPTQFASALVDILNGRKAAGADLRSAIDTIPDKQVSGLLAGLYDRAGQDIDKFQTMVGDWFDSGMDQLSADYQAKIFWWNFGIALIAAALLNIDAFAIAQAIWTHPGMVDTLTAQIGDTTQASNALAKLQTVGGFPMGWAGDSWDKFRGGEAIADLAKIGGFLTTALAAMQGAPFWFNLLKSVKDISGGKGA